MKKFRVHNYYAQTSRCSSLPAFRLVSHSMTTESKVKLKTMEVTVLEKKMKKGQKRKPGRKIDSKLHYQVYIQEKRTPHPKEEEEMDY